MRSQLLIVSLCHQVDAETGQQHLSCTLTPWLADLQAQCGDVTHSELAF